MTENKTNKPEIDKKYMRRIAWTYGVIVIIKHVMIS